MTDALPLLGAQKGDLCRDRVCVVTGAGRGIGLAHAAALAAQGARVVVNDVGAERDGSRGVSDPATEAVATIQANDGVAIAHQGDVSTAEGAESLLELAITTWGRLDVVVNNAGILRDRMIVNMTEDDWDSTVNVHLRSTFLTSRSALRHWRECSKRGEPNEGRIINTTSSSGLYGNVGQSNYGAAKAAIAAFTMIAAMEAERYGVTVNAICPTAKTRMTAGTRFEDSPDAQAGLLDPRWVSPALVWLASPMSRGVTGRIVIASGRNLAVAEGWSRGPTANPVTDPAAVDDVMRHLLARAAPNADMRGDRVERSAT